MFLVGKGKEANEVHGNGPRVDLWKSPEGPKSLYLTIWTLGVVACEQTDMDKQ